MNKFLSIAIVAYLIVGVAVWEIGYFGAPSIQDAVFTFLYVVFLWPLVLLLHFFNS